MNEEKEALRKRMLDRRRGLSPGEIAEKSLLIRKNLLLTEQYKNARTALVYVSTPDEVRTDEIISARIEEGKKTAVPSLRKNRRIITPSLLLGMDELSGGVYGIREPRPDCIRPVSPSGIDLVIAPGAAFDSSGCRVGMGGGYYDRLLVEIPPESPVIALAFSFQVKDRVPSSPHDVGVDLIITEDGPVECAPKKPRGGRPAR